MSEWSLVKGRLVIILLQPSSDPHTAPACTVFVAEMQGRFIYGIATPLRGADSCQTYDDILLEVTLYE